MLLAALMHPATADMIPMSQFRLLKTGMTESEVLYRVGPGDYESVRSDHFDNVLRRVWAYIPTRQDPDTWITEIEFDHSGVVQDLRRYRVGR